jgi:hypothetical protein
MLLKEWQNLTIESYLLYVLIKDSTHLSKGGNSLQFKLNCQI